MSALETGQNSYPEPPPERWRALFMEAAEQRDAALSDLARLRAELEGARRDAARYRWLRDAANAYRDEWNSFGPYSAPSEIDAAIDAAIAAQGAN